MTSINSAYNSSFSLYTRDFRMMKSNCQITSIRLNIDGKRCKMMNKWCEEEWTQTFSQIDSIVICVARLYSCIFSDNNTNIPKSRERGRERARHIKVKKSDKVNLILFITLLSCMFTLIWDRFYVNVCLYFLYLILLCVQMCSFFLSSFKITIRWI